MKGTFHDIPEVRRDPGESVSSLIHRFTKRVERNKRRAKREKKK